jgi:hypothetical protein
MSGNFFFGVKRGPEREPPKDTKKLKRARDLFAKRLIIGATYKVKFDDDDNIYTWQLTQIQSNEEDNLETNLIFDTVDLPVQEIHILVKDLATAEIFEITNEVDGVETDAESDDEDQPLKKKRNKVDLTKPPIPMRNINYQMKSNKQKNQEKKRIKQNTKKMKEKRNRERDAAVSSVYYEDPEFDWHGTNTNSWEDGGRKRSKKSKRSTKRK